jgi:hypothetical protein
MQIGRKAFRICAGSREADKGELIAKGKGGGFAGET